MYLSELLGGHKLIALDKLGYTYKIYAVWFD